jgi:hypothetical protein
MTNVTGNKNDVAGGSSGRPTEEELWETAREMHCEFPDHTVEEWYEDLKFASYAFPTLEERISMVWRDVRLFRRQEDIAELKRLLARRKEFRARNRR